MLAIEAEDARPKGLIVLFCKNIIGLPGLSLLSVSKDGSLPCYSDVVRLAAQHGLGRPEEWYECRASDQNVVHVFGYNLPRLH